MPQPKKPGSSGRRPAAAGRKPQGARKTGSNSAARKPAGSKPAHKASAPRGRGGAGGGRGAASKPASAPPPQQREDALPSAIASVRELLSRGIMITGDRVQETVDEAVHRGRMTRADAEELVQALVEIGRRQTQDALAELEGLVERSAEGTRRRTGSRVRSVAAAARRVPGTDRALRTVDRARRAAGLGSSFPVIGYHDLTAGQVKERLADLTPAELRKVRDHERRNANRKSILGAIEKRLG